MADAIGWSVRCTGGVAHQGSLEEMMAHLKPIAHRQRSPPWPARIVAESGRIVESGGKRETHETSATRTSMRVGSSTRRSAATRAESGRAAARVRSAAIRTIRVSRGKTSRVSAAQSLVGLIAVGHRCVRWCVRGSAFATSRAHLSQVGVAKTKASRSRKGGLLRTHHST